MLLGDHSDTCVNSPKLRHRRLLNRNASSSRGSVSKGAWGGVSVTTSAAQLFVTAGGSRGDTEGLRQAESCLCTFFNTFKKCCTVILLLFWKGAEESLECGICCRHLNHPKHSAWLSHLPLPSFSAVRLTEMESCPSRFYDRQPLPVTILKGEAFWRRAVAFAAICNMWRSLFHATPQGKKKKKNLKQGFALWSTVSWSWFMEGFI